MEIQKKQLNSWHWLIACIVLSLITSIGSCHVIRSKMVKKRAKTLPQKEERLDRLSMLNIETIDKINDEVISFNNELNLLKIEELEGEMKKMPLNSDGVLKITTEINKYLIENNLRLVERSLKEEKEEASSLSSRRRRGVSSRQKPPPSRKKSSNIRAPFKTVEYCFKVDGKYKNMFMFLVKQSFQRRSYNLKDIEIINNLNKTMRLNFTLQVNYRK